MEAFNERNAQPNGRGSKLQSLRRLLGYSKATGGSLKLQRARAAAAATALSSLHPSSVDCSGPNKEKGGNSLGQRLLLASSSLRVLQLRQRWRRFGSVRHSVFSSIRPGSNQLDSARLNSARLDSIQLSSIQLGSARLGSAQLDCAALTPLLLLSVLPTG